MWRAFDEAGRLLYPDFMETVIQIVPMYWVRLIGGTMYLIGMIMLGINMIQTIRNSDADLSDPEVSVAVSSN